MCLLAVGEIAVTTVVFLLPFAPQGVPWHTDDKGVNDFTWTAVNYTPIVVIGALILLWLGWHLSAKKWFTGPKNTINLPAGMSSSDEIALEHGHPHKHEGGTAS